MFNNVYETYSIIDFGNQISITIFGRLCGMETKLKLNGSKNSARIIIIKVFKLFGSLIKKRQTIPVI